MYIYTYTHYISCIMVNIIQYGYFEYSFATMAMNHYPGFSWGRHVFFSLFLYHVPTYHQCTLIYQCIACQMSIWPAFPTKINCAAYSDKCISCIYLNRNFTSFICFLHCYCQWLAVLLNNLRDNLKLLFYIFPAWVTFVLGSSSGRKACRHNEWTQARLTGLPKNTTW